MYWEGVCHGEVAVLSLEFAIINCTDPVDKMEAKVVMVHLLRTYHLSLPEDYKLEIGQTATAHPKGGVPCTLLPRK